MIISNSNIAVVAYDAGAANHIFSWLKTGYIDIGKVHFCVAGPASKICAQLFPDFVNNKLERVLNAASVLISGTGWMSSLEHKARCLAVTNNIRSIAVLDHWTNYRERFIREGFELLPDEVWVVDEYAYDIAQQSLPNVAVALQRNDFIASQLRDIEEFNYDKTQGCKILFVMEPIRLEWGDVDTPREFQALQYFIENMSLLGLNDEVEIKIKPHPSDPISKYDSFNMESEKLDIKVDALISLAEAIAWSNIVVGCQTYAMVVALAASKQVVSTLPPIAPSCQLPQKEIIVLNKLV